MTNKEKLINLAVDGLKKRGIYSKKHMARLISEFKGVSDLSEHDYFLNLVESGKKYSHNEHNLLLAYVLGIVDDFDIEKPAASFMGEFPDTDVDYIKEVRDYLKEDWAPKCFGRDKVCWVGSYTTFGIKSSLVDMARVYGLDRQEILSITTKLPSVDEDGKSLTLEKAKEISPALQEYCKLYPDATNAADRLLNRNRGMGTHAGGLIISKSSIDKFIPLVKGKDGAPVSAFVEGLHGTDLGPLGLVKFDLLIVDLFRIYACCKLIKDRHNVKTICALPGQKDFSDTSYLNDPKAIAIANKSKLKCVFQFDSDGMRELVKKGGVTNFDDLVAYTSLYRPGPMGMGMHDEFVRRKKGEEDYWIHPALEPILGVTYGIMVYQEQVMKILNVVGDIPLAHCEKVRKAISKKKEEVFVSYKESFVENGQKVLDWDKEKVEILWDQIASFAEYGFNKSMTIDTLIPCPKGLKEIASFKPGESVYCVSESGETQETKVIAVHDHGWLDAFEVEFDDGYKVTCSANHKFLTKKGQMSLREICETRSYIYCDQQYRSNYAVEKKRWMEDKMWEGFSKQTEMGETPKRLQKLQEIKYKRQIGKIETYCSVWEKVFDQKKDGRTSSKLSEVSKFSLEEVERDVQSSLWTGIQNSERKRFASQVLSKVRNGKKDKYKSKDGQAKRGQQASRQNKDYVGIGQENFCTPRNPSSTCESIEKLERREPREVCKNHRGIIEKFKKISNGGLALSTIGLGYKQDSLWREKKTSGFCEREDLDRSRRILSFLRTSQQSPRPFQTSDCSTKGPDVERGSGSPERCHVNSNRYDMFQEFKADEGRLVQTVAEHAPISNTGNLVSGNIVRIRAVGKRRMCDLEVANPTHNFLLPNGVVTSNSHATAYTYISSRMLWLKAHYPIEFFAATLSCEGKGDRVKEYKVEAERCGIKVNRVDVNNSGWTFEIAGKEIYMGFSNIKGIGEEIAQRIVASQPYSSFEDFLARFGTDAKVLKPLIGLNLFEKDGDRKTLYEFYEYYKDKTKKRENRNIRNKKSRSGIVDEFRYLLYNEHKNKTEEILKSWIDLEDKEAFQQVASDMLGDVDTAWKTFRKYKRNVTGIQKKIVEDEDIILSTFVPKGEINPKVAELYNAIPQTAEREFYGFAWDHILEYSEDYRGGYSFDGFEDETKLVLPIEAQIIEKTQKKLSKKGTEYYIATIEDANGVTNRVTIWEEDYQRFEKEFEYWDEENSFGNLVRIKLERPGPGFRSFTFDSPPKYLRHKLIPEDKSLDGRLMVLAFPKIVEEKKFVPVKPQEQEILVIDGGVELDLNYLESL